MCEHACVCARVSVYVCVRVVCVCTCVSMRVCMYRHVALFLAASTLPTHALSATLPGMQLYCKVSQLHTRSTSAPTTQAATSYPVGGSGAAPSKLLYTMKPLIETSLIPLES